MTDMRPVTRGQLQRVINNVRIAIKDNREYNMHDAFAVFAAELYEGEPPPVKPANKFLRALGVLLVSLPFLALALIMYGLDGWRAITIIGGICVLLVAIIGAGVVSIIQPWRNG